nr:MAG TPA: hypothetical protein [Caudoviricetes sp.]
MNPSPPPIRAEGRAHSCYLYYTIVQFENQ